MDTLTSVCEVPTFVLTPNTPSPDANVVINPKGTGFYALDEPTPGSPVGGNCRGINAVDLQQDRAFATQVASGDYSIVLAGQRNTASGRSAIAAGQATTASGLGSLTIGQTTVAFGDGSIAAGRDSIASGEGAFAHGVSSAFNLQASGVGSEVAGQVDADSNILAETIAGQAIGSKALGLALTGGVISVDQGHGALSRGQADTSGVVLVTGAQSQGAEAAGLATDSGLLQAGGAGSRVAGQARGLNSVLITDAGGEGANGAEVAGLAQDGNAMQALGNGARALGTVSGQTGGTPNFINAVASGALAAGQASGTAASGSILSVLAGSYGGQACGQAVDGSIVRVLGASPGSAARGLATGEGVIQISGAGSGCEASGQANTGGVIAVGANSQGSKAFGLAENNGLIVASGAGALAVGATRGPGQDISAVGEGALAHGAGAQANQLNSVVLASGSHSRSGDAQTIFLSIRAQTTLATPAASLALDGAALLPRLTLDSSAWSYELSVVGISSDDETQVHSEFIKGAARKNAFGQAFIVGLPVRTPIASAAGSTVSDPVILGTDQFNVVVNSGGEGASNMRWYATLEVSQVALAAPAPSPAAMLRAQQDFSRRAPPRPDTAGPRSRAQTLRQKVLARLTAIKEAGPVCRRK